MDAVIQHQLSVKAFRENPGIIDAHIVEEAGQILMRKICSQHGPFEDLLATDADFFKRMERLSTGRDFACTGDGHVHNHGPLSIKFGRGMMLVFDLTNRCNMKCTPCYMDANHHSYVHELAMEDVKAIFGSALSFKPRREVNVLFSGGEPTLSPIFLDALRYGQTLGFKRLHVATNGIRFAEEPDFALQARAAGLHAVYLQFDSTSNRGNLHRGISNFFDVKVRALENIARADMRVTLQVAVTNGVNNAGLGDVVRFAIEHIDKIHGIVFQPIMFAGRDQNIEDSERYIKRYTLSQLAQDLKQQSSVTWEPLRDWFPMSSYGAFANLLDIMRPNAEQGTLFANVHPNHGIFSPLLVNRRTKQFCPVSSFFNVEQFLNDITAITDSVRGRAIIKSQVIISMLRNCQPDKMPPGLSVSQFRELFESTALRFRSDVHDWSERPYAERGEWRLLIVGGMWFQDLFNYDVHSAEASATPVVTQEGEIPFCAYNAAGWRTITEFLNPKTRLSEWHKKNGRHEIFAKGKLLSIEGLPSRGDSAVDLPKADRKQFSLVP